MIENNTILRVVLDYNIYEVAEVIEVDQLYDNVIEKDRAIIYIETNNPIRTKAIYYKGRPLEDVFDRSKNKDLDYLSDEAKKILQ